MKRFTKIVPIIMFTLAGIFILAGIGYLVWEKTGHFMEKGNDTPASVVSVSKEDLQVNVSIDDADKDNGDSEASFVPKPSPAPLPEILPEKEPEPEPEPVLVENPYKDWFLKNSDMIAWMVIPDTNVDYPVMWTPGDEQKYLKKNFEGKKERGGCLLLDTDTCLNPVTTNLIIHGHNNNARYAGDKTVMFGNLSKYEKQSYRDEHPYIYLYGRDYEHIYEVMCVFRSQVFYKSDTCFKYYNFFNAETEEEFKYFYDNVKALSYYDTGVEAEFGDHFLTLSTCSYHVDNGRFVVVAKEIEAGDRYEAFGIEE